MAKTRDRVSDVKPYVERAIKDEEFRDNLKSAFVAARDVYDELMGPRGVGGKAAQCVDSVIRPWAGVFPGSGGLTADSLGCLLR